MQVLAHGFDDIESADGRISATSAIYMDVNRACG